MVPPANQSAMPDWAGSGHATPLGHEGEDFGTKITNTLTLKVYYNFGTDDHLARLPHPVSFAAIPIDDRNTIGVVDLAACLEAVTKGSPELESSHHLDYSLYAYDFSEPGTPLVGYGLLSTLQGRIRSGERAPHVTARIARNPLALLTGSTQEMLEVKLKLSPVPKQARNEGQAQPQLQPFGGMAEDQFAHAIDLSVLTPDGAAAEWEALVRSNNSHLRSHMPGLPYEGVPSSSSRIQSPALGVIAKPQSPGPARPVLAPAPATASATAPGPAPAPAALSRQSSIGPTPQSDNLFSELSVMELAPGADDAQDRQLAMAAASAAPAPPTAAQTSSRPSSSRGNRKKPTGRPRGRPRKLPAPVEGSMSGYEDGTDGDEGPTQKKRATVTSATVSSIPSPFITDPESLRVAASTSGSIRSMRPAGLGITSDVNEPTGNHDQTPPPPPPPRAPTPVPSKTRARAAAKPRAGSSLRKQSSSSSSRSQQGQPKEPRGKKLAQQRQSPAPQPNIPESGLGLSPAPDEPPSSVPARPLQPSQSQSPYTPNYGGVTEGSSPAEIGSSPPIGRVTPYLRSSPLPSSPMCLPRMPLPQLQPTHLQDSGFMSGGAELQEEEQQQQQQRQQQQLDQQQLDQRQREQRQREQREQQQQQREHDETTAAAPPSSVEVRETRKILEVKDRTNVPVQVYQIPAGETGGDWVHVRNYNSRPPLPLPPPSETDSLPPLRRSNSGPARPPPPYLEAPTVSIPTCMPSLIETASGRAEITGFPPLGYPLPVVAADRHPASEARPSGQQPAAAASPHATAITTTDASDGLPAAVASLPSPAAAAPEALAPARASKSPSPDPAQLLRSQSMPLPPGPLVPSPSNPQADAEEHAPPPAQATTPPPPPLIPLPSISPSPLPPLPPSAPLPSLSLPSIPLPSLPLPSLPLPSPPPPPPLPQSLAQSKSTRPILPPLPSRPTSSSGDGPGPPPILALPTLAAPQPPPPSEGAAIPGPSSPPPPVFVPLKMNKNAVKKQSIKHKLETAVLAGEMPPYCSNCGAIETPTWRKVWTQERRGAPGYHEYSDKPGHVTAIEVLERSPSGEPISYRLVKKALGPDEDRDEWKMSLLCNPCGIWLSKCKSHRPRDRWDKDQGRIGQARRKRAAAGHAASQSNRNRKRTRTGTAQDDEPTSDACQATDPAPSSPKNMTDEEIQLLRLPEVTLQPESDMEGQGRSRSESSQSFGSRSLERQSPTAESFGADTVHNPTALGNEDLGSTRRVLFPTPPRKDISSSSQRALPDAAASATYPPSQLDLGMGRPKAAATLGQDAMVGGVLVAPAVDDDAADTADADDMDMADVDDDVDSLFRSPNVDRPSTPPPPPAPGHNDGEPEPFKTPTRATPTSHRPITRSVSKTMHSGDRARCSSLSAGGAEPAAALLPPQTPSRAPRTPRSRTHLLIDGELLTPSRRRSPRLSGYYDLSLSFALGSSGDGGRSVGGRSIKGSAGSARRRSAAATDGFPDLTDSPTTAVVRTLMSDLEYNTHGLIPAGLSNDEFMTAFAELGETSTGGQQQPHEQHQFSFDESDIDGVFASVGEADKLENCSFDYDASTGWSDWMGGGIARGGEGP